MKNGLPVSIEDTNREVIARIARTVSEKFDCTIEIDFRDGKRQVRFVGDRSLVPHIAREVHDLFRETG